MIEKQGLDVLTLSTTLYDLSVSRNLFQKTDMREFGSNGNRIPMRLLGTDGFS